MSKQEASRVEAPILFNGKITIENTESGNHRTFQIKTQSEDSRFAPGSRILALLTGPDNVEDYRAFGFVKDDGRIILWKKFRSDNGKPSSYEMFADMIRVLLGDFHSQYNPNQWSMMKVHVEKRCLRCNRVLTEPESVQTGIGPECRKHLGR